MPGDLIVSSPPSEPRLLSLAPLLSCPLSCFHSYAEHEESACPQHLRRAGESATGKYALGRWLQQEPSPSMQCCECFPALFLALCRAAIPIESFWSPLGNVTQGLPLGLLFPAGGDWH